MDFDEVENPIVIQATMESESFPKKVLEKMPDGSTLIEYLVKRIRSELDYHKPIVLATSNTEIDIPLEEEGRRLNLLVIRDSSINLIERMLLASEILLAKNIIRIMGISPLVDLKSMNSLLDIHLKNDFDYSYNGGEKGVISGMDVDIFKIETLEKISQLELNESLKRDCELYIRNHTESFKIYHLKRESHLNDSQIDLWIDTPQDLERVRKISENVTTINDDEIRKAYHSLQ